MKPRLMSVQFSGDAGAVEEMQGLYGPFTFPEKLLQKIWARRDYAGTALKTVAGEALTVIDPGRWNTLGGPDFRGARLRLGGREIDGDVELHLKAADWQAHGHAADPAYAGVVLHVVLFPSVGTFTPGWQGGAIPVISLLPYLLYDLEAYAAEDAIETLAGRPSLEVQAALTKFNEGEWRQIARKETSRRWQLKVATARRRLAVLGWEQACHHAALEILGYRFNRVPMLETAGRFPLAAWRTESDTGERAWVATGERWSLQGVRPANHPRRRLRQYAQWVRSVPEWPERLRTEIHRLPTILADDEDTTAAVRRRHGFARLRKDWVEVLTGRTIGGTRLDNLFCDGWLPLLAAEGGDERSLEVIWRNWYVGDMPTTMVRFLRDTGLACPPEWPASHGAYQGLLGWRLKQEAERELGHYYK